MTTSCVTVVEMDRKDLAFVMGLWRNRTVMRYAWGGFSRSEDASEVWEAYQNKRRETGNRFTLLIVRLSNRRRVGMTVLEPIKDGESFGEWKKPTRKECVIGDVKILPEYWGKGLGTIAMRENVRFAFDRLGCDLYLVPPFTCNTAALRVYEKAGFQRIRKRSPWRDAILMSLTRKRYEQLYS